MEMRKYPILKANGSVTIQKLGENIVACCKRYDSSTGNRLVDEVITIVPANIDASIAALETDLAALKELQADMEAL